MERLICIPPELEAAARRYIKTRQEEVTRLKSLLDQGAFEEVRIRAHNMKGAGQSFGFPPLTVIGGQMEGAAQRADIVALMQQLDRMQDYVAYAASVILKSE